MDIEINNNNEIKEKVLEANEEDNLSEDKSLKF